MLSPENGTELRSSANNQSDIHRGLQQGPFTFVESPNPSGTEPRRAETTDPLALFRALAEASAVFLAFTFFGGWSYLASYYSAFGLNPLELDVSVAVVSTMAIYVLFDAKWPLFVVAVLLVLWAILAERLRRFSRSFGVMLLVFLLLTVSTAGIFHGRKRAAEDAVVESSTLPFVAFAVKLPTNDQPACVEYKTYGSFDCKLLLHFDRTYYFFQPIPVSGKGSLNVFAISDSDVAGAHILRGLQRNEAKR